MERFHEASRDLDPGDASADSGHCAGRADLGSGSTTQSRRGLRPAVVRPAGRARDRRAARAQRRARGRDGRAVSAQVVGFDLDSGLGVVKLEGPGPWPVATLGDSRAMAEGARTGTVGVDEDNDLVQVTGTVNAVRRFSAYWEYMLDRAIIVAPASPHWGGSAVVNDRGELIGIASLRLGEAPHVNLAIPIEKFVPVKDELIESGRIASRPPRPWLGLYTVAVADGLVVSETSPVGPASRAGFRQGDRILRVNGVAIASQEEFYEQLWSRRAGDLLELAVQRDNQVRTISVPSVDRHRLYPVR